MRPQAGAAVADAVLATRYVVLDPAHAVLHEAGAPLLIELLGTWRDRPADRA